MAKMTVVRTGMELPRGPSLDAVRAFLFDCFRGLRQEDDKAWRRFWKRLVDMSPGEIADAVLSIPRNWRFHKKFFALLDLGFESWEPDRKHYRYKGREISKNFDQFREDVTILAGFYEQTFDIKGRMKYRAKSISFAKMDDVEFDRVYYAVVDVLLREVCKNYKNREEIDRVVNQILNFS